MLIRYGLVYVSADPIVVGFNILIINIWHIKHYVIIVGITLALLFLLVLAALSLLLLLAALSFRFCSSSDLLTIDVFRLLNTIVFIAVVFDDVSNHVFLLRW